MMARLRRPLTLAMLRDACTAAGVELGAYDEGTLAWLANYEPESCKAIAGIIHRAAQPPEGTVTEWGVRHPTSRQPDCVDMLAVLDELAGDEDWFLLVLALLEVGSNMVKAARGGREDEYLARVAREASLDEVSGADPGGQR